MAHVLILDAIYSFNLKMFWIALHYVVQIVSPIPDDQGATFFNAIMIVWLRKWLTVTCGLTHWLRGVFDLWCGYATFCYLVLCDAVAVSVWYLYMICNCSSELNPWCNECGAYHHTAPQCYLCNLYTELSVYNIHSYSVIVVSFLYVHVRLSHCRFAFCMFLLSFRLRFIQHLAELTDCNQAGLFTSKKFVCFLLSFAQKTSSCFLERFDECDTPSIKNLSQTAGFPKASDPLFLGLGPPNPLVAPLSGTLDRAKFWGNFECRRPSENSASQTKEFVCFASLHHLGIWFSTSGKCPVSNEVVCIVPTRFGNLCAWWFIAKSSRFSLLAVAITIMFNKMQRHFVGRFRSSQTISWLLGFHVRIRFCFLLIPACSLYNLVIHEHDECRNLNPAFHLSCDETERYFKSILVDHPFRNINESVFDLCRSIHWLCYHFLAFCMLLLGVVLALAFQQRKAQTQWENFCRKFHLLQGDSNWLLMCLGVGQFKEQSCNPWLRWCRFAFCLFQSIKICFVCLNHLQCKWHLYTHRSDLCSWCTSEISLIKPSIYLRRLHLFCVPIPCFLTKHDDGPLHRQFFRKYSIPCSHFDSTKGYPGEGPTSPVWSCHCANIESLQAHSECNQWNSDLSFLQEVRLAKHNIKECESRAAECGKKIFTSSLLRERKDKNGIFKTPHGGTAFLGPSELCKKFDVNDDSTGLWKNICDSTRITGIWYQVLPKLRILCWSFYGQTYCADGSHKAVNDHLLEQIFEISSQFGDIPVLVAGDFQSDPNELDSFTNARRFGWCDPLTTVRNGEHERPITFSRTSNFENPTYGFSSIDGILMNDISFQALQEIRVCHEVGTPHAPIYATFVWPRVFVQGTVLVKPASFDLTNLPLVDGKLDECKIQDIAKNLWTPQKEAHFSTVDDEEAWSLVNRFAIEVLLRSGARFNKGLQQRGQTPQFRTKACCPGQDQQGNALSNQSARLCKIYRCVSELRHRLVRSGTTTHDFMITWNLQQKVANHLRTIPGCRWWNVDVHCDQVALLEIQKTIHTIIIKVREKEKRQRISSWKQKMIEGTRSRQVSKFVFKWMKAKMFIPTPNLITNCDGNIIADPIEAMKTINDQWDNIFSANVLCENPMKVVEAIWPKLVKHRLPGQVPPITGDMLKGQVKKRRIDAACGLDGWRTPEMQVLPTFVYDIVARFFQQVELGIRNLPSILTSARQALLDKSGEDGPLQKRIISVLPIFMISYTSVRFKQMQNWQTKVMPPTLFGGIRNRKMSQLQTQFKIALDQASVDDVPLCGLKLDKSKCFDRLIPSTSCALMLAIGVPTVVVTMFANMYRGMRKYLSYKSWTSSSFTTSANGVLQGCSFSLLAINAHMMVWSILVSELPDIYASAYIDDSYLWAKLANYESLHKAVEVTKWWDNLTGQLANDKKTVVWATTTKGRKEMKNIFPAMNHQHSIEILGASIQTTKKQSFEWNKEKTSKMIREIQLIKAIPTCRNIHEHLIGTKIIPQLSTAAHVVNIPKNQLKTVQNSIVDLLWKKRPPWRARPLVIGLLARPHRVDPVIARSYNVITECVNFLKHSTPQDRFRWTSQFEANLEDRNLLVVNYKQACYNLGCKTEGPFHLSFLGSSPVCILDFGIRDLKAVLQIVCRDMCYKEATKLSRKDLQESNGTLDFPSTCIGHRSCKGQYVNGISMQAYRDSVMVGCNTTNDRRHKAGFSPDNLCRFCKSEPETFLHLTAHCESPPFADQKPDCPSNCGPNFQPLGIVEISNELVKSRLSISQTHEIPVSPWSQSTTHEFRTLWTDGSCLFGDMFWRTKGAAACVDKLGNLIFQVEVHHISLNSYSCELWALVQAFCRSDQPCARRTDCASLVTQVSFMMTNLYIPTDFLHFEWWSFFLQIYKLRLQICPKPLCVSWIPSHLLEHIPVHLITFKQAIDNGSNWEDIFCNREADYFAKQCATQQLNGVVPEKQRVVAISKWQRWLALVNSKLSEISAIDIRPSLSQGDNDENDILLVPKKPCVVPSELTVAHPICSFQQVFPKWVWQPNPSNFNWKSNFIPCTLKSYASISQVNWDLCVSYLNSLVWVQDSSMQTAYVELAFGAWSQGFHFVDVPKTPKDYAQLIRKCINQCCKLSDNGNIIPGQQKAKCKSQGRTLPAGYISDSWALISCVALKHLAIYSIRSNSQKLSDWGNPFP